MADDKERLVLLLEAQTKAFENALKQARTTSDIEADKMERRWRQTQKNMERRFQQIAGAARTYIAGYLLTQVQTAVRDAVRSVAQIGEVADRIGVSTTALQEMRYAIISVGGASEQADAALTKFAEKLGEATLTQSGSGYNMLQRLGFTADDIANMRSVEQALPRIADRIAGLSDATERMRAAKELGLDPFIDVINQGAGAFDRAAQRARNMGYVLDRELIARTQELNGEWQQMDAVLKANLSQALVELGPTFVDLARAIAAAAVSLSDFLGYWRQIDEKSTAVIGRRLDEIARQRAALRRQFPVRDGVDPLTDESNAYTQARARWQSLNREAEALTRELLSREPSAPTPSTARPPSRTEEGSAADLAAQRASMERRYELAQMQDEIELARLRNQHAIADALEDELEIRVRIAALVEDLELSEEEAAERARQFVNERRALLNEERDRQLEIRDLENELDLARAAGDERAIRALERRLELTHRIRDLESLSVEDAKTRAEAEIEQLENAEMRGHFRDWFSDGVMAALDDDLKDFMADWMRDRFSRGMREALDSIADALFRVISGAFPEIWRPQGPLPGVGSVITSIFGGGKGFGGGKAIGGAINPGYSYYVHKDEMITPQVPSFVIPKGALAGGGMTIQQIDNRTINFTGTSEELHQLQRALAEDRASRRAETVAIVNDARARRHIR